MTGKLVISLDFELYWGVRDKRSIDTYRTHLLGVREAVPALLDLFDQYGIRATWATVGFLFFGGRKGLMESLPERLPHYRDRKLSPYGCLDSLGDSEASDPFHFAPSLVERIASRAGQEIATHTFSHYYCLEDGQTIHEFRADLIAARRIAKKKLDLDLKSIVFPRNQFNAQYLAACAELGFRAYRGNLESWLFEARTEATESKLRRGARLIDSYVPISGRNAYALAGADEYGMINVPASRFLRPFSPRLRRLDRLRAQRIVSDMSYAAKHGDVFHLWWHPHNFGVSLRENLAFLSCILDAFVHLRRRHRFESASMGDLADAVRERM